MITQSAECSNADFLYAEQLGVIVFVGRPVNLWERFLAYGARIPAS